MIGCRLRGGAEKMTIALAPSRERRRAAQNCTKPNFGGRGGNLASTWRRYQITRSRCHRWWVGVEDDGGGWIPAHRPPNARRPPPTVLLLPKSGISTYDTVVPQHDAWHWRFVFFLISWTPIQHSSFIIHHRRTRRPSSHCSEFIVRIQPIFLIPRYCTAFSPPFTSTPLAALFSRVPLILLQLLLLISTAYLSITTQWACNGQIWTRMIQMMKQSSWPLSTLD
jgi:hypothetical protein